MLKYLNENNFNEEVLESSKTVLVDFFATWCMPCKMLGEVLEELDNEDSFDIVKVDIDEYNDIAEEYDVEVVPTMILIANGVEVKRFEGYMNKENLLDEINNI